MDDGKNLVKLYWHDVRERVAKVEPIFAQIVNELNPDKTFPLYLAYYPYGATDADTQSSLFPKPCGGYFRISDNDAPKDIVKHLGYSVDHTPLGMVLEKELECFIDLKKENITLPWLIYKPGAIFPFSRILNKKSNHNYTPNGLLSSTAGARSAFMLPNIGSAINHSNLQRDFNIRQSAPKSLYDHWHVFKEIVNSDIINTDWRCCVMYFSEKWLTKIYSDSSWSKLKHYLHELGWHNYEYERNRIYYDITYSIIQRRRNLKPNPYLADTAKHLFATASGSVPGYTPAIDDSALPLDILQKIYIESYGLKKYLPTIMQTKHFDFERDISPIYYSLQHPSTHEFSPKSREISSTLVELRELEHIMRIYTDELSSDNALCSDTVIGTIAKNIKFDYFHNKVDRHKIVRSSKEIIRTDQRFNSMNPKVKKSEAQFASDAPFVRGCISIRRS